MRILLDAHALLWWLGEEEKLSTAAREAIETAESPLVGAGTLVEIAVKRSLKKLLIDEDWPAQTQASGIDILAISWSHASALQSLPFVKIASREHRDPFDRLLAVQAIVERIPVVTRDPAFAAYGVPTIW